MSRLAALLVTLAGCYSPKVSADPCQALPSDAACILVDEFDDGELESVTWAVHEMDGMLSWETSMDGRTWDVLHAEATPIDLSAANADLEAETFTAITGAGRARFDHARICPAAAPF